jgi:hypothetical protein
MPDAQKRYLRAQSSLFCARNLTLVGNVGHARLLQEVKLDHQQAVDVRNRLRQSGERGERERCTQPTAVVSPVGPAPAGNKPLTAQMSLQKSSILSPASICPQYVCAPSNEQQRLTRAPRSRTTSKPSMFAILRQSGQRGKRERCI